MTTYSEPVGNRAPTVYRGSQPASGRRPRTNERRRCCPVDGCGTVLSRYNLGDLCRVHSPIHFPRVRGNSAAAEEE